MDTCISKYRILGLLGKGGMGAVYLAEQTGPDNFRREVVLKLLRTEATPSVESRRLLHNEAQLTALINHPNVVTVHEFGEHHGQFFMVLERVRGISFQKLLSRAPLGRVPPAVASALIAQACDGLHAAHSLQVGGRPLNIIHRDVSTSNLMCDIDGRVRVIDFGIARAEGRRVTTDPSIVRGNVAYMAPEQRIGQALDRTVDIFALAVIYYELCTGVHPFQRQAWRTPVPRLRDLLPQVSVAVSDVLAASLSLEPAGRPQHVNVLGEVLWEDARRGGFPEAASVAEFFEEQGVSLRAPDPLQLDPLPAEAPGWRGQSGLRSDPPLKATRKAMPAEPTQPLVLSEPGRRQCTLRDGNRLELYITHIRTHARGPHRIGLSRVEGLLPVPLACTYSNGTLGIYCAPGQSQVRAALYLDARQPSTRMEHLLLTEASPSQAFDLGHRRHASRRISCEVLPRTGAMRTMSPSAVPLPVSLVAPDWTAMLVLLTVPMLDAATVYFECICIERGSG